MEEVEEGLRRPTALVAPGLVTEVVAAEEAEELGKEKAAGREKVATALVATATATAEEDETAERTEGMEGTTAAASEGRLREAARSQKPQDLVQGPFQAQPSHGSRACFQTVLRR